MAVERIPHLAPNPIQSAAAFCTHAAGHVRHERDPCSLGSVWGTALGPAPVFSGARELEVAQPVFLNLKLLPYLFALLLRDSMQSLASPGGSSSCRAYSCDEQVMT